MINTTLVLIFQNHYFQTISPPVCGVRRHIAEEMGFALVVDTHSNAEFKDGSKYRVEEAE